MPTNQREEGRFEKCCDDDIHISGKHKCLKQPIHPTKSEWEEEFAHLYSHKDPRTGNEVIDATQICFIRSLLQSEREKWEKEHDISK